MTKYRSIAAGMTDYTGVSLTDIISHLHDWYIATDAGIKALQKLRKDVSDDSGNLRYANDIIEYIDFFHDLFSRYAYDFQRLINEMKDSVQEKHIAIISQIYESSRHEERICVLFKNEHINRTLENESKRPLLDEIYEVTRGLIIDYEDLSNVQKRLITFVENIPFARQEKIDNVDLVELKPNLFGLGINLNNIIKRFVNKFKEKINT